MILTIISILCTAAYGGWKIYSYFKPDAGKLQVQRDDATKELKANEQATEIIQRVNSLSDADVERILRDQFSA